jgi:hypothetical protein
MTTSLRLYAPVVDRSEVFGTMTTDLRLVWWIAAGIVGCGRRKKTDRGVVKI